MVKLMTLMRARYIISNIGRHHDKYFITDDEYHEALKVLDREFHKNR